MEKRLLITRADEKVKYVNITHPIIKRYAKDCNADFMILDGNEPMPLCHFRILKCYNLLEEYDRVLHLDSDILIRKGCPNFYEYVDVNKIGTVLEDKGSRKDHRRSLIKSIQEKRGYVEWNSGYINTGVFIASKQHKEMFNVDKNNLWMDFGQDDVELGYSIHNLGFEIQELSWEFNCMSMFEEDWANNSRFNAYILHYAGGGFHRNILSQYRQIEQDANLLERLGELY